MHVVTDNVHVPQDLKDMLVVYSELFQAPSVLPPRRQYDHQIQLLSRATPVNIRPYKYSPARSPFEVLYSYPPKHFGISSESTFHSADLEQWLTERNLLNDCIQHHLHRAQQRMKCQADKNRSERELQEGDMVYLKLQLYV